jgi:hypothetical protein
MPISIDTSEYIKQKRLLSISNGHSAAEARKFRAPTRDTVYDPNLIGTGAGVNTPHAVCEFGQCNGVQKPTKHALTSILRLSYKSPCNSQVRG